MMAYWGSGGTVPLILWPRHHIEVSGQIDALTALSLGKTAPGTHWIGPRASLDAVVRNSQPLSGLELPIIQPVARRYTTELYYAFFK
jgi:hypothetical protein